MKQAPLVLSQVSLFSDIDREFGHFCGRLAAPKTAETLSLLGALVSHARSRGDSCLLLEDWAGKPIEEADQAQTNLPSGIHIPPLGTCLRLLQDQEFVGDGTKPTPLVLAGTRLYLYRYWRAEQDLAAFLSQRLTTKGALPDSQVLAPLFSQLFGPFTNEVDWQAVGAFATLKNAFTLITGGPGTGKTTTVVRMLAILLRQKPDLKIALAAPTGKAAARLAESLSHQIAQIPDSDSLSLPTQVQTLHRLLGYLPYRDTFRYNGKHPLPHELVVVDEASMVDVLMMANLVRAIGHHCRLILLGDHQQLASVDAGSILADICQAACLGQPHSPIFREQYSSITGQKFPPSTSEPPPWRDHVVHLQKSRRFADHTGLGIFSKAVQMGNISEALEILKNPRLSDLHCMEVPHEDEKLLDLFIPALQTVLKARSLEEAFKAFQSWQLLTALREGRLGVSGLNQMIEEYLRRKGIRFTGNFYARRPLLVTQNDYTNQLFNGDLGMCWPDANNHLKAYFPNPSGGFQAIPLLKLSAVESAWALTIHKSQGSEFDQILLVLPPIDHPLATRELVYTGITRAKSKATLLATLPQVSHALERITKRASGLAELLLHNLHS